MRLSKKAAKAIKTAIIAYHAYHEARQAHRMNGMLAWGNTVKEHRMVYEAVGLDVRGIITWYDEQVAIDQINRRPVNK